MNNFFRIVLTQPLFNLLIVIYAVIPGNDFGIALILFTVVVRLALWPVLKKQLHQQKAMRELQPEITKIKQRAKGDKQREAQAMMELYKEREINPLGSLGVAFLQLPILIALFVMLQHVVNEPVGTFKELSYSFTSSLEAVQNIISGKVGFEPHLFGIDLTKHAFAGMKNGLPTFYWPGVPIAILAGIGQFLQTRQLMGSRDQSKGLKQLLRDAKEGKEVSQSEQQAVMTGSMSYVFPVLTLVISFSFPLALPLYWVASSFIAVIQQRSILNQDIEEMAQVPEAKPAKKTKPVKKPKSKKSNQKKKA